MKDRIYTSKPVDKTARLVTGEQPDDDVKRDFYHGQHYLSKDKPPTIPWIGPRKLDLTGKLFAGGRMIVIGLFVKQSNCKSESSRWLVQCKCGYYTVRKGKTIRKNIDGGKKDCCQVCKSAETRRRSAEYFANEELKTNKPN